MDLLREPRRSRGPQSQRAFVASVIVRDGETSDVGFDCVILCGTQALIEDLREAGMHPEGECLGLVPEPGFWVWEGCMETIRGFEGDYDVDYQGKFRRATDDEIAKIAAGQVLWPWAPEAAETEEQA